MTEDNDNRVWQLRFGHEDGRYEQENFTEKELGEMLRDNHK